MKEIKALFLFRSFRSRMMLFFVLAMVFAGATSNFLIYRYALKSQFEQLREKLMAIAQTASIVVDVPALEAIPLEREGLRNTNYLAIHEKLEKIKSSIPTVKYLYILKKTEKPGILQFIIDANMGLADDNGPTSYPGDEYDASRFPEMMQGFEGPAADRVLTEDAWGVFLSGYAPIRDQSGEVVAILGVDMTAQDVHAVQKEVQRRAIIVFILGIILAVLFGFFISHGVSRQIRELTQGVKRVATGDLDSQVAVKGVDEIAQLAGYFNQMSVDLKRHINELQRTTAEKERLVKEIEIARGIQQSFLPDSVPQIEGIEIAVANFPARTVGGDFYDFIPIEKDKWGLVIADVSGKGVPAALFMALSRTLMRASAAVTLSPAQAVNHANDLILQDSKANMFVTLFYALLDAKNKTLTYANAGHNPPLLLSKTATDIVLLKAEAIPLGIMLNIEAKNQEIALEKGDIVVLYTDGVTEARSENKGQFEIERLENLLRDNRLLSAQGIMRKIENELTAFVGGQPQFDDITLMIIKGT